MPLFNGISLFSWNKSTSAKVEIDYRLCNGHIHRQGDHSKLPVNLCPAKLVVVYSIFTEICMWAYGTEFI